MNAQEWAMPDGHLPAHLTSRLTATLTAGAPLQAPLASQARYARPAAGPSTTNPLWRTASVAGAALAALVLVALVGPQEPRGWLLQSIGSVALNDGAQVGQTMTSPKPSGGPPANAPNTRRDADKAGRQAAGWPAGSDEPTAAPDPGGPAPGNHQHGHGKPPHPNNGNGGPHPKPGKGDSSSGH
jgi:hypothetical protein